MFYQLPPAGNPVRLSVSDELALPSFCSFDQSRFYNSGTAALAAAIGVAKKLKNNNKNSEVILPAYACPDLVSAAVFSGVKPILVDFEPGRPWLNLQLLADAITANTVAIVAVNLLGINERWKQLRKLADDSALVLIEDSAQSFPVGDKTDWQSDLVIFSFGRGKPVGMLGGGAVFCNTRELFELLPVPGHEASNLSQQLLYNLKAGLYNAMISPFMYWLPQVLPFLHLGETRYHELKNIETLDEIRANLMVTNIHYYQKDEAAKQRCSVISTMLDSWYQIKNLPRDCGMSQGSRYLRYPLLLEAESRNRVYKKLKQAGLGPSILYPEILPNVAGLEMFFDRGQKFSNAELFASCLLTLPTHSYVSDKNIKEMSAIFKNELQ